MICSYCDSSVEILAHRKNKVMCLACAKAAWEKEKAAWEKELAGK